MEVERRYEKLRKSMVGTFFPGELWDSEVKEWEAILQEWKEKKAATVRSDD
jgi:hypothetical protein